MFIDFYFLDTSHLIKNYPMPVTSSSLKLKNNQGLPNLAYSPFSEQFVSVAISNQIQEINKRLWHKLKYTVTKVIEYDITSQKQLRQRRHIDPVHRHLIWSE